ncbi:Beta-propeller repeat protein [anaerobic digester metagenome]
MKTKITMLLMVMFLAIILSGVASAAYTGATPTNYTIFSNESLNANDITTDSQGNIYVTGSTSNAAYTITNGTYTTNSSTTNTLSSGDVYIAKYNSNGTLIFSTVIGGTGSDSGNGISVDKNGNIYVTGATKSTDLPVTNNAYQKTLNGGADAFVFELSADGTQLLYCTYLGGSSTDTVGARVESGTKIKVDSTGNIYVLGQTNSADFPTTTGAYKTRIGSNSGTYGGDAFITKFNSNWNMFYSTLFGGNTLDDIPYGLVIDNQSNVWITGKTTSTDLPVTNNACQKTMVYTSSSNAFLSEISADGSTLLYSTYFGAKGNTYGYAITKDSQGNIYITGQTTKYSGSSSYIPVTSGAYQTTLNGASDAYVAKFNASGSLLWCTFFGGSGADDARAITVDSQGNVYITGRTSSTIPSTYNAIQTSYMGGTWDAFIAKLNANGTALLYASLLGTKSNDFGYGVVADNLSTAYVIGTFALTKIATAPDVTVDQTGGLYNTIKNVTLTAINTTNSTDTIYYTTDGTDPKTSNTRTQYNGSITINNTTTLRYAAVDSLGNWSPVYNETYTIDTTAPTATSNPIGGLFNTTQTVTLTTDDNTATTYYTTDGSNPTTSSTRTVYNGPIAINGTTTLLFAAVDAAGNWSPVYKETYKIKSDVYVNVTPSNSNPQVGDTVTYKFKLGNNGPGIAKNVTFTYTIPEGLEYEGAIVDQGNMTYNATTRTLTWNLGDVAVGDPNLWLQLKVLTAGNYNIQPTVTVAGYNPNLESHINTIQLNIASPATTDPETVNAATTTKTIPMKTTGMPITALVSSLLMIGSGLAISRKK